MNVLVSDKVDKNALSAFKKNKIDFDYLPETTPHELLKIINKYAGLIVRSRTTVTKEVINQGKKLKVIARAGSGVDNIDLEAAAKNKIIVVNSPGANTTAVVELTMALILSLLRKLAPAYSSMKQNLWLKKELKGTELYGKTVGIVGLGNIGKKIRKILLAFGAKVEFFSRRKKSCSLEKLFKISDIITLHLSLTPQTKNLINKKLLSLMKPTAFIINTSRGKIIDEEVLYRALLQKKIGGAGLDVYWQEPLSPDSKWRKLDNAILTPHIAASTSEALSKATQIVVADVILVLKGEKPLFVIANPT